MPCIEANHVTDALLTPFRVDTDAIEIVVGRTRQKSQVRLAQDGEVVERLSRVRGIVSQPLGPEVLVVSGQLRPVLSEHHPNPVSPDQVGIGEVLQDLGDRPLAGSLGLRDFLQAGFVKIDIRARSHMPFGRAARCCNYFDMETKYSVKTAANDVPSVATCASWVSSMQRAATARETASSVSRSHRATRAEPRSWF